MILEQAIPPSGHVAVCCNGALKESAGIYLPRGVSPRKLIKLWFAGAPRGARLRTTTMVPAVAHGAEQGYDLRAGQRQRTIFGFSQPVCARCAKALVAHGAWACAGI